MKNLLNKELAVKIGQGAMKYGKLVVVEGIKSIAAQGAMKVVNTAFDDGLGAVKELKFDDVVGINDKKEKKKRLFGKTIKKEAKVAQVVEVEDCDSTVIIDENDVEEIVKKVIDEEESK